MYFISFVGGRRSDWTISSVLTILFFQLPWERKSIFQHSQRGSIPPWRCAKSLHENARKCRKGQSQQCCSFLQKWTKVATAVLSSRSSYICTQAASKPGPLLTPLTEEVGGPVSSPLPEVDHGFQLGFPTTHQSALITGLKVIREIWSSG